MNTEPDEYNCACPDGYSGKNCQIGNLPNVPNVPNLLGPDPDPVSSVQPNTPARPIPAPTGGRVTRSCQALSATVRQAGLGPPAPKVRVAPFFGPASRRDDVVDTPVYFPDTDECASNPCPQGGTCIDLVNGFECICPPQWAGKTCQIGTPPRGAADGVLRNPVC